MSRSEADLCVPVESDVLTLAAEMRQQDVDEMHALGHTDMAHVLRSSIAASTWCRSAFVDGDLVCMFGVGRIGTVLAPIGTPWMLGTDLVRVHRRHLAALAPGYIAAMLQETPHLMNMVHARNSVAVQWLKRVGFTLHPESPQGPYGEPFHIFEMRANV